VVARLTTPFWTLKPSWYLVSGRLIFTSTTGGHDTAVSFTAVLFFVFWRGGKNIYYQSISMRALSGRDK
jgi:hypothetical protein